MAVASEIELPGLPVIDAEPDLQIRRGAVPALRPATSVWCIFDRNDTFFSNSIARFAIRRGQEITVDPHPGAAESSIQGLLKGKVMSLALRQRGWLPLHASAVNIKDKAILFMGISGAGKSTLAVSFDAPGHRLLADDVVGIRREQDGYRALPGFARVRLDEEAAIATGLSGMPSLWDGGKRSIDVSRGLQMSSSPVVIRAIVALEFADQVRLTRADLLMAAAMVDRNSMLRHLIASAPSQIIEAQLKQSAQVAAAVPVYLLDRPKNLASLTEVRELVEGYLGE